MQQPQSDSTSPHDANEPEPADEEYIAGDDIRPQSLPPDSEAASEPRPVPLSRENQDGSTDYFSAVLDAFILFNEHEIAVQGIVDGLGSYGITTYFWRRDIPIGVGWQKVEEERLRNARCVLIFLGEKGWGPNHARIAQEAVAIRKRIIPILIGQPSEDAFEEVDGLFRKLRYMELQNPDDDSIQRLASVIQQSDTPSSGSTGQRLGTRHQFVREASPHDGQLYVAQYAHVLAEVIQNVGNEESFSFALLGAWGRGKTFLMRLVGDALPSTQFTVVTFSAWKYRTTPELWLTSTRRFIGMRARPVGSFRSRTGLLRHGLWPAAILIFALACSVATISQKWDVLKVALSIFGVAGVTYLAGVAYQLSRAATNCVFLLAVAALPGTAWLAIRDR